LNYVHFLANCHPSHFTLTLFVCFQAEEDTLAANDSDQDQASLNVSGDDSVEDQIDVPDENMMV
jgi:hypothetical protein